MTIQSLRKISRSLEATLKELEKADLTDHGLRHRYAEFYVAAILAQRGHKVQMLSERDDTAADIYLPQIRKRVEVKSSKASDTNGQIDWAYASFGKGKQIAGKRFDYCVFVVFDKTAERVWQSLVFTQDELRHVAKVRTGLADHEDSNPCLLVYAPTVRDYEIRLREWGVKTLAIEQRLCRAPKEYMSAWEKIQ